MNDSPFPTFSLIVPTIRRLGDLKILFDSLLKSDFQDFEVIVVDQNEGPLIDDLCEKYGARFPLRHLKISKCGGARARNYGRWFARGAIVNFPDDDCALTPGLLGKVARRFSEEPGLDIVFGRSVDSTTGASSVNRFSDKAQPVTLDNLYYTTVEFTMFARRSVIEEVGPFDETLGVGTYYGADEGADFFLRALYLGKVVRYDPALVFHHPQKTGTYDEKEFRRALSYGRGFGRMSAKHWRYLGQASAVRRFVKFQVRAIGGVLLFGARLNFPKSWFYVETIRGRIQGAMSSWDDFAGGMLPPGCYPDRPAEAPSPAQYVAAPHAKEAEADAAKNVGQSKARVAVPH